MKKLLLLSLLSVFLIACGDSSDDTNETGSLKFTLNAEDFVRDGFVSEDGYRIDFENVYINIQGITAYQVAETEATGRLKPADPLAHAGHPHAEIEDGTAHSAFTDEFFIDGHPGPDPILLGTNDGVAIGNYNYLNFKIQKATSTSKNLVADYEGYSVVMIGKAKKDNDEFSFNIKLTEEMEFYSCGPHPEKIGVVQIDGTGEAQATMHFDHIFGDKDEGPADTTDTETVNYLAIGFGPFATLAKDGKLDVTQDDLKNLSEYSKLIEAIKTLGHTGEAHCLVK